MEKSGNVRVVKDFKVRSKKPRVDFRAKRGRGPCKSQDGWRALRSPKMKVVGEEGRREGLKVLVRETEEERKGGT